MIIGYIIIGFIFSFFTYKKFETSILEKRNPNRYNNKSIYLEIMEVWYCIAVFLFWWVIIPAYILWQLLDLIYNKFNKQKQ